MVLAGLNHFRVPGVYRAIVPGWLPAHGALVAVSGAAEVVGGLAAIHPRTRPLARPWLVALLAAVSPVHVWMVRRPQQYPRVPRSVLWARLPLQVVMAWLVLRATDAQPWPTDALVSRRRGRRLPRRLGLRP
jgi:uncharacterized membrane protein